MNAAHNEEVAWRYGEGEYSGLELAEIKVPVDYDSHESSLMTLGITRIRGTASQRATLMVGPGDDLGNRGIPLVGQVYRRLPASIRSNFDIIGFDHRFMGSSSPMDVDLSPSQRFWVFHQPVSEQEEYEYQRAIAEKMLNRAGHLLPHANTQNIARDMDRVRRAVGADQVSFLGYSYATYVGAVYRSLYPERCAAVVLDSPCSPEWLWRGLFTDFPPNGERSLDRFSTWLAYRSDSFHLGMSPMDCRSVIDSLFDRAERSHISLQGMPVDKTLLTLIIVGCLNSEENYSALASIIRHFAVGSELSISAMRFLARMFQSPKEETGTVAQIAVLAGDVDWPTDRTIYETEAANAALTYPVFGKALFSIKAPSFMEGYIKPDKLDLSNGQHVPTLVVSSEDDMSTPISAAHSMVAYLGNARQLVLKGVAQHRVFPFKYSQELTPHIEDFLMSTRVPGR